jgi:hypothetical protein
LSVLNVARIILALACFCLSWPSRAQENLQDVASSGLSLMQAKRLLLLVLRHEHIRIKRPGMYIESLKKPDGRTAHPGYFDFTVTHDSESTGATEVLGSYSVSIRTGDIWEVNLCKHYDFAELSRAQKAIQKATSTSPRDEKDSRRGLGCSDN